MVSGAQFGAIQGQDLRQRLFGGNGDQGGVAAPKAPRFGLERGEAIRGPQGRELHAGDPYPLTPASTPVPSFGSLLERGVRSVAAYQNESKSKLRGLITGETKDVHEVLVAMGKAEVATAMMLEIRNRLTDAWREVTRIQV